MTCLTQPQVEDALEAGRVDVPAIPFWVEFGLIGASCILLRLATSPAFKDASYEEQARAGAQRASQLSKQISIDQTDVPWRSGIIVSQLLTSKVSSFYHNASSGTIIAYLALRTRLIYWKDIATHRSIA